MQKIIIRPMRSDDIEPCANMIASTMPWQRYGITPEIATTRLETGLRGDSLILVAGDGSGNLLGFVWLVKRGAFDLSGYIRWIVVATSHRSSGVGRQLLAAAEDSIRQTSHDIFLLCSDFNLDAQRFYERNGYIQVGVLPDYVLPGVAELIYRKRLA